MANHQKRYEFQGESWRFWLTVGLLLAMLVMVPYLMPVKMLLGISN